METVAVVLGTGLGLPPFVRVSKVIATAVCRTNVGCLEIAS